jgi:hypothetical protein
VRIKMTPGQFQAHKQRLMEEGALGSLTPYTGQIQGFMVTLNYWYEEKEQALTLTIQDRPFFISEATVWRHVRDWFGIEE